jgi:hypothetical protein
MKYLCVIFEAAKARALKMNFSHKLTNKFQLDVIAEKYLSSFVVIVMFAVDDQQATRA